MVHRGRIYELERDVFLVSTDGLLADFADSCGCRLLVRDALLVGGLRDGRVFLRELLIRDFELVGGLGEHFLDLAQFLLQQVNRRTRLFVDHSLILDELGALCELQSRKSLAD